MILRLPLLPQITARLPPLAYKRLLLPSEAG